MTKVEGLEADYLVVGAGATGMAFTDALTDHADVSVIMVDRRPAAGGHWLDAYSFVRLHQASSFYGVASTLLGAGRIQQDGPEAGLHARAAASEICAYYDRTLHERMIGSGKVAFYPNCDYVGEDQFVSRVSGKRYAVRGLRRVVDARYLSPGLPATTPPPFGVADGAHVIPVNDLVKLGAAPSQYVIVGSGKTATDACIWLLENSVDPDTICWVRPRDPWMLNRAVVQPDPIAFLGTAADIMEAAAASTSPDEVFFLLEDAGVMFRIDRSVTPTMAKVPTLAQWELDRLRTIDHVVRLGHLRHVEPGRLVLAEGEVPIAPYRVRRGDARGRWHEEPHVPTGALLQHDRRLGTPAGPRHQGVVPVRKPHQGLGRGDLAQPWTHPAGAGRLRRAAGRPGATEPARGAGHGSTEGARWDVVVLGATLRWPCPGVAS
jgi:NAD(P)-binding Rossmann-like domain